MSLLFFYISFLGTLYTWYGSFSLRYTMEFLANPEKSAFFVKITVWLKLEQLISQQYLITENFI